MCCARGKSCRSIEVAVAAKIIFQHPQQQLGQEQELWAHLGQQRRLQQGLHVRHHRGSRRRQRRPLCVVQRLPLPPLAPPAAQKQQAPLQCRSSKVRLIRQSFTPSIARGMALQAEQ
jgi:hypothetical protein